MDTFVRGEATCVRFFLFQKRFSSLECVSTKKIDLYQQILSSPISRHADFFTADVNYLKSNVCFGL